MRKKLLIFALAAALACGALASQALAAEAHIDCVLRPDGGLEISVPAGAHSGRGLVQIASYSAQGKFLDFRSIAVDDLAQGYHGVISAKTEPGGGCKIFFLGGDSYRPLAVNAQVEVKAQPELLSTVTGGAKFLTGRNMVWNKNFSDYYLGVDCESNGNGGPDPSQITFYVNGLGRGAQAVDARSGDIAKLYDTDGNGRVDAVMITQYHVARLTGDVTTKGNMVSIPGVTDGFFPVERVNGAYAALHKDDVVLFYTTGRLDNQTVTLEIPETVTGKVSMITNKGQVRLSGGDKRYDPTGIRGGSMCSEDAMCSWGDFENEYTFYLDKNGGVCYYVCNTDIPLPGKPSEPSKPVVGIVPTGLIFRTDARYGVDGDGNCTINVLDPETGGRTTMVVDSLSYVNNPCAMYTVDAVSGGVVTAMTEVVASNADKNLTVGTTWSIASGLVMFSQGPQYEFDYDETVYVVIDLKRDGNSLVYRTSEQGNLSKQSHYDPDILECPSTLYVITDENKRADYIYEIRILKGT